MKAGFIVALSVLAVWASPVHADAPSGEPGRTAVISAFHPELEALIARTQITETVTINGIAFRLGTLSGKPVVVFSSGISMVNATMATQLALERFDIERIVFSGIAGGVDPAYRLGDVIVPARWGRYLEAVYARETGDGYSLPAWFGEPFGNHGMIFPQEVEVRSDQHPEGTRRFWFETDPEMLELAGTLHERIELSDCVAPDHCLSHEPRLVIGGNGVSGSAFVDNADFRDYVHEAFEAKILDMESAAVAMVAFANGVPFIAFRSLSDLAGGDESENEIETFMELAAANSVEVLAAFFEILPD